MARATGTAAAVCGSAMRQEADSAKRSCKASPFMEQAVLLSTVGMVRARSSEMVGGLRPGPSPRYLAPYPARRPASRAGALCYGAEADR
ncbi:hypothetical protein GCM10023100_19410 [Actinocorallia cavernae]|uniref:Uncharacterized protein n=2 Tax=Actinomycetes TaxID=1760 RepID=A0ABP8SFK2_9ACTN